MTKVLCVKDVSNTGVRTKPSCKAFVLRGDVVISKSPGVKLAGCREQEQRQTVWTATVNA